MGNQDSPPEHGAFQSTPRIFMCAWIQSFGSDSAQLLKESALEFFFFLRSQTYFLFFPSKNLTRLFVPVTRWA